MLKHHSGLYSFLACIALAVLLVILWGIALNPRPAQAGNGLTVDIPQSNIIPVMDGVCNLSEYSDATPVTVTVGTSNSFPVYMKHTANDAYFCFGNASGLPLPNGGSSQVAIYIDNNDDGSVTMGDDFGIWMPYASGTSPWAAYWNAGNYNGADPGGWEAVKYQPQGVNPPWQVEFRISHATMGGWKHTVALAPFYHWWRWVGDDYSWPVNGIWASPDWWGNGRLTTSSVNIGGSITIPTIDGQCGAEYSDASTFTFNAPGGIVTAYLKHSPTDLFVCLHNLTIPAPNQRDVRNAALYIDRTGIGSGAPGSNDLLFTISYSGTIQANIGDGIGYTGPDPGGYTVARSPNNGGWDAEFQISGATIGNWWLRKIGLMVAEQGVNAPGDDYGWPKGYSSTVPDSWGDANLTDLAAAPVHLPLLVR